MAESKKTKDARERRFYDVGSRKKFTAKAEDIKLLKGTKTRPPALVTESKHGDYKVWKWVSRDDEKEMLSKYGRGKK